MSKPRLRLDVLRSGLRNLADLTNASEAIRREQRRAERRIQRRIGRLERRLELLDDNVKALLRSSIEDVDLPYPEKLVHRRFRLHSQNAEDGITIALLEAVGVSTRRFIELGSGDNGGNSGVLAIELGWSGLFVDASADHLATLRARLPAGRAKTVQSWLTAESVGDLLALEGLSGEIDFLGVDVDGNDYWLWEALTGISPRVVVIEYNAIFGPERVVVVPYDPSFDRHTVAEMLGLYYGASLRALVELGRRKGYRLVAVEPSGVNAYFVRDDVSPDIPAVEPQAAFRMQARYAELISDGFDIWHEASTRGLPLLELDHGPS
jgi:hypothetical protein